MPLSWVGLVCCMWVGISRCWWPNWSWRISERSATRNIHIHAFILSPINLIERPCLLVCHEKRTASQPMTNGKNLESKFYDWARPWRFGTGSVCILSSTRVNCSPFHCWTVALGLTLQCAGMVMVYWHGTDVLTWYWCVGMALVAWYWECSVLAWYWCARPSPGRCLC